MFPVLFDVRFGGREIAVHSYGVLIAVGLALGIALAHHEARRAELDGGRLLDLAFWMVVAGLVGARVVYVVVNARDFVELCVDGSGQPRTWSRALTDCARVLAIWEGGLVFYGGVAAAGATAYLFSRRERWSFLRTADLFAPALALGHAFGRIGCFAAGCCFGKESAVRWAMAFPKGSVAFDDLAAAGAVPPGASLTAPLHPTQLYEAAGELVIFAVLMAARTRWRSRENLPFAPRGTTAARPGRLFALYLLLYAPLRFVIEMFRGDAGRRFVAEIAAPRIARGLRLPATEPLFLSVGQLSSALVLVALAITYLVRRRRRAPATRTPGP